MAYVNLYNQYFSRLNKGIKNHKEASEVQEMMKRLREAAKAELNDPSLETKKIQKMYMEALDKAIEAASAAYQKVFQQAEEVKKETFIEPVTPEMDSTVNALTSSVLNQIEAAKRSSAPGRVEQVIDQALNSREGAMALLRLPVGTVNGRRLEAALEASKSPEYKAFEKKQSARLEILSKQSANAFMDGFHMRNIKKILETREGTEIASLEAAASDGKNPYFGNAV